MNEALAREKEINNFKTFPGLLTSIFYIWVFEWITLKYGRTSFEKLIQFSIARVGTPLNLKSPEKIENKASKFVRRTCLSSPSFTY